jgi:hypothetical protein
MIGASNLLYWLIGTGVFLGLFITFVMQILWGFDDDETHDDL